MPYLLAKITLIIVVFYLSASVSEAEAAPRLTPNEVTRPAQLVRYGGYGGGYGHWHGGYGGGYGRGYSHWQGGYGRGYGWYGGGYRHGYGGYGGGCGRGYY
jgi:hypothetical protein